MLFIFNDYSEKINITYWPEDNIFTDEDGFVMYNIFEYISRSDYKFFRENPHMYCMFTHVDHPNIAIDILYDYEQFMHSKLKN